MKIASRRGLFSPSENASEKWSRSAGAAAYAAMKRTLGMNVVQERPRPYSSPLMMVAVPNARLSP